MKGARRGEIHWGDLAFALASLPWQTDGEAKAIAACLGFGLAPSQIQTSPSVEIYDRLSDGSPMPSSIMPQAKPKAFIPPAPRPLPPLPATALSSQLQSLQTIAPAIPDEPAWLDEANGPSIQEPLETGVARQTLFPGRTCRHILAAALATRREGQDIDLPTLIRALCRREAVNRLPRRPEATLENGCDLLLDYSSSMVPFWEDLNSLAGQATQVVGSDGVRVFSFDTRPTEAKRWTTDGKRRDWLPQQRPVLVATDFGIAGREGRADLHPAWSDLIAACVRAGAPLLVFIPWPEHRWPKGLGSYPKLAHWSPRTTAAMVKQQIGLGHRLG